VNAQRKVASLSTGIGEALRAARRRQGHALADVAASTRVRESYLAALESEEFDALGDEVYVRGFITAYARFLGLDPEPLLAAHREHVDRQGREQRGQGRGLQRPASIRVRSGRVAVLLMLALVVLVALVVAGLWGGELANARLAVGAP
jgi:cytoskeleton protein RodZ